jgi:hypothetical protein
MTVTRDNLHASRTLRGTDKFKHKEDDDIDNEDVEDNKDNSERTEINGIGLHTYCACQARYVNSAGVGDNVPQDGEVLSILLSDPVLQLPERNVTNPVNSGSIWQSGWLRWTPNRQEWPLSSQFSERCSCVVHLSKSSSHIGPYFAGVGPTLFYHTRRNTGLARLGLDKYGSLGPTL